MCREMLLYLGSFWIAFLVGIIVGWAWKPKWASNGTKKLSCAVSKSLELSVPSSPSKSPVSPLKNFGSAPFLNSSKIQSQACEPWVINNGAHGKPPSVSPSENDNSRYLEFLLLRSLKVNLTHLCFADDLLIFTKGSLDSIMGIKGTLQFFYTLSGLQLNSSKSEVFSTGISINELQEIHEATGFKLGSLPIRYLGVPLVTRRLLESDCAPLLEKISARINGWAARHLSYAGRVQLIQSVLFNVQNFWCRHFLLPKAVIKRVNQMCSSFLWKGQDSNARGARVSWDAICKPKSEGGLGLKNLLLWNQACALQHIWALITKAGSLWIAWVTAYVLKGSTFWNFSPTSSCSWSFKKLLKLRELARDFIIIENGCTAWKFPGMRYKVSKVWKSLRGVGVKVHWQRLIWFPLHIPKHSMIAWMAILNKLPTKDRLISWGLAMTGNCVLCNIEAETRDHLVFDCIFSKEIWRRVLLLCRLHRRVGSWAEELNWAIEKMKGKAFISTILRLAWTSYIYFIWRERNGRIFRQEHHTEELVLEWIKDTIKLRLFGSSNILADAVNVVLCQNWGLSTAVLVE